MANIKFDHRTGQMTLRTQPVPVSADQLLAKIKRIYGPLMSRNDIDEAWVKEVIKKVNRGTRNIHYLDARTRATTEIAYFVLREFTNG